MNETATERPSRLPAVFVFAVWAALAVGAVVFVFTYGWPFPIQDDLEYAPFAGRERAFDWKWIWQPHVEHRIPIPRLILLSLLRITQDFRSGMVAEVVVLAALAAAMVLTARHLRGRTSYTDAFFPLVLLHTGNAENLLMAHQLSLMLPIALSAIILLLMLRAPEPPSGARLAGIAICLLALPLNGGHGLVQAPAWILALAFVGLIGRRSDDPRTRRAALATLGVAAAGLLVVVLYFLGYRSPATHSYDATLAECWETAIRFVSLAFGPCGEPGWPWTGWVVGGIWVTTLALIARTLRRRPEETARAIAIVAQLAAIASMGISVGIGRGSSGAGAGFAWRYIVLPAPALCAAYFAWMLYAPPAAGRFARVLLAALAASVLFFNVEFGIRYGLERIRIGRMFVVDVQAARSFEDLARRHARTFFGDEERFARLLERLSESGLPPYEYEHDVPARPFHMMDVAPVSAPPVEQLAARWMNKRPALVVPVPSELRFSVPPDVTRVVGFYGVAPVSWREYDGVPQRFEVVLVQEGREQVLLERLLEPVRDASQRGLKPFDVALTADDSGAEIVLRVTPARPASISDRAAWSGVGFH